MVGEWVLGGWISFPNNSGHGHRRLTAAYDSGAHASFARVLLNHPAIGGRAAAARLPARFPPSPKCTFHPGLGLRKWECGGLGIPNVIALASAVREEDGPWDY